jgi:hypothetical protein
MIRRLAFCALAMFVASCARDGSAPPPSAASVGSSSVDAGIASIATTPTTTDGRGAVRIRGLGATHAFATLPDRGDLVAYAPGARQDGAYTWYPARLSEAHALRAIVDGHLRVTAPDGTVLDYQYDRHVEHPSGDWTWIGHLPGKQGDQAIITFGSRAAFGTLPQPGALPLRLTVRDGTSWMVRTDGLKVAGIVNAATRPTRPDFLVVPRPAALAGRPRTSAAQALVASPAAAITASATTANTIVDVVLGYTPGFAADHGGNSGAVTRLNFLVDVANAAYTNSGIAARVRLVATVPVNYTDTTTNDSTLEQLSGYKAGTGRIAPAAAFNGLRAARDQYGADLVSLVRKFKDPEQDGCGIAWLIGGSKQMVQPNDGWDTFGFSVVSDGTDAGTDGKNYYCLDETLAHEFGHNMGAAHDRETAKGDDGVLNNPDDYGAFDYSFGYKDIAHSFYTVMAYGDTGQRIYRIFSDPTRTFCGGFVCGQANIADNARTLRQIIPVVATFRNTVVAAAGKIGLLDLVGIHRTGATRTEMRVASRANNYKSLVLGASTGLGPTGTNGAWAFGVGDYNGDGTQDLYAIKKPGASGRTEVYVLNGVGGYTGVLLQKATALAATGTDQRWILRLGDYNRDGRLDLYAIDRKGGSGKTEIHVLNGADNFSTFLTHRASALPATGADYTWRFELGDYNRDGILDIYGISKMAASGKTEVHVLDGASGFTVFSARVATAMGRSGSDNSWDFKLGDYNKDGIVDLYAIYKMGGSGFTEAHVMDGRVNYSTYLTHVATVLPQGGTDSAWEYEVARAK